MLIKARSRAVGMPQLKIAMLFRVVMYENTQLNKNM
jgi:hypothetical protein